MTQLSVNLNKVALLRNSRSIGIPSPVAFAEQCVAAGAHGITVHPRPDQRHIRPSDVYEIADLLRGAGDVELNIEGNPFPEFVDLVMKIMPTQCTLVPDAPNAVTSDHGWELKKDAKRLKPIISELRGAGMRVALFMDADSTEWQRARDIGADRVELYTEPFAAAFARGEHEPELARFRAAAGSAQAAGLGVNAGHDLNLQNLAYFCQIPDILEVSIGHALIADALEMGMAAAVQAYLKVLSRKPATGQPFA
jgi:pyridoxine 5-phosphate synthase